MTTEEKYMYRCLELAARGAGYVMPNPMVGAVLVHNHTIIGEGWHKKFGEPHAEVNCLASVKEVDKPKIPESVLYVSLEPCAHYGKTPPCAPLIVKEKIPKVVIGHPDPFQKVNGAGLAILKEAGTEVICGVLEKECRRLNRRFLTFHTRHRPYIILKWAQTVNGKIAAHADERLIISNELTNRLVHKWRSEEASILVGTHTAQLDNPQLTTRLWKGPHPIRLALDKELELSPALQLFNQTAPTIVFNFHHHELETENTALKLPPRNFYYRITADVNIVHQIIHALYHLHIQSVLVEGGARTIQSFIEEGLWDEARVITNTRMKAEKGLAAPELTNHELKNEFCLRQDLIRIFKSKENPFL
ncbi:MAG: bifunctional diaminohydroxyphosphoribosylaminopyrimidine deaminase/5-amino-6-(5-phosphoribosylamino)uracil reductase RibD [Chitinophagaceae bacterium]|nr:bifunctional diaminohydroxyphosphoribosylaminopyrimidine deaminase/5-amino-6-(5-phosphoribosylamino)uracil reductase RibD [Chitinophagaceae bacterium]